MTTTTTTVIYGLDREFDEHGYRPSYAPQAPAAAKLRGVARYRCKRCNCVFTTPVKDGGMYYCPEPSCHKAPRYSIDVPEPNPAKDGRRGEKVVIW